MIQQAIEKAAVLIEALPYIQQFRGETVVVKFGGSLLNDMRACRDILKDIAFMECVGMRPVVVHGGGKAINKAMAEAGLTATFLDGLRVTDAQTVEIVDRVLNHEVNPELVEIVKSYGCQAEGVFGQDVLSVEKVRGVDPETGDPRSWGFVGTVTDVDVSPIRALQAKACIPVMTPLGKGPEGVYNVNADEAAGAVARALGARKLVFLSDVPGLLLNPEDRESVISSVNRADISQLIERGVIAGGMLPKVEGAVRAIESGIKKVHFIDAGMNHSLLLELFTEKGVGTEITA